MSGQSLFILLLRMELVIPDARSLKEKRAPLKSLKERIRGRFNVSIAEVGYHDKWQRALLGACMLGGEKRRLESEAAKLLQLLEETPGISIVLFTSPWCGSCKAMKKALENLPADTGIRVFEVDAGTDQALVESFEVFHLPALFLYQDGAYHAPLEVEPVVVSARRSEVSPVGTPADRSLSSCVVWCRGRGRRESCEVPRRICRRGREQFTDLLGSRVAGNPR